MDDPEDIDDETLKHHCQLNPQDAHFSDIVKTHVETGIFVELRRKLRRITMISHDHPMTSTLIRSANEMRYEERRHLLLYPNMIHPFSKFSLWFSFVMLICYLEIYVAFTVQYVINKDIAVMRRLYYITTPFYVPLIITSFFTGYHDPHQNRIVLKFSLVFLHYANTYMVFDFLYLSGIFFVVTFYDFVLIYSTLAFAILPPCAFARYPYFANSLKMLKMYSGMETAAFTCLKIILNSIICFLFIFAYIFFQLKQWDLYPLIHKKASRSYVKVHRWVKELVRLFAFTEVMTTLGQAHSNIGAKRSAHHYTTDLVPIIFIPLGFICQVWFAVKVMRFWHNYYSNEGKNDLMHLQFKGYIRHKALPDKLQKKITVFLDFKFQKQLYEEKKIDTMVTDKLRKEIVLNATRYKLGQVELFRNFPDRVLRNLLTRMELEIFMPGDVIVKAGATGTCMFFISVGTVSVTTRSGKEVCELRDGAHVGEIALITRTARVANVTAVTPCELYRLKSKHFQKVMARYPELLEEMCEIAFGRIAKTSSFVRRASHRLTSSESKANLEEDTDLDESEEDILHLL